MARKPRMGRNLNALLSSAVKERRERSDEGPADERAPEPPLSEEGGSRAGEPTSEDSPADARVAPPRAEGSSITPLAPGAAPSATTASGVGAGVRADVSSVLPIKPEVPFARSRVDVEPPRGPATDVAPDGGAGRAPAPADDAPSGAVPPARRAADTGVARDAGLAAAPSAPEPSVARIVRGADVDDLPVAPGDPPGPGDRLRMIGVERIRRGVFQPRRFFDQEALQELADSLKAQGMIQPIIVRPFGGAFELIAGERRWRAAQIAGLTEIPAIVREMEDRTVAAVSLIENIQREDLNPLEEAQALTRLCDEFGMTHASVAESIGRSRASVSNLMRLLDLHDEVKVLVDKGELDMGHARALLRVPKVDQPALALRVAKQGLTVRAVEKLIRTGADKGPGEAPAAPRTADPDVRRLEERLAGVLGAPVAIHQKAGGAGRLEIRYTSLDELEGILEHIK